MGAQCAPAGGPVPPCYGLTALSAMLAENFDGWLRAIEACFVEARERLPEGVDPRQLAVFVLTTMEGAVMLARTYRDFEAYDAAIVTLRDYVERLLAEGRAWSPPQETDATKPTRKK